MKREFKLLNLSSMSESYKNILHSNSENSDSKSNVFIAQCPVKSWKLARPLEFSYL
jgi:hypothetical protein